MKKIHGLKFHTFDGMLKKQMKSAEFRVGYYDEVSRLRLTQQLKEARLKKKYTQEGLAKKANMPQSVIARLESGKKGVSLSTLNRLAYILGKKIQLV